MKGGGQERGARAGTENVPGIAGLRRGRGGGRPPGARGSADGVAARSARIRAQGDCAPGRHFRRRRGRLPNTTLFAVPGVKAETAVIALDLEGVAVSSGAACSSGKVTPSHVLAAMGVTPDLTRGAIRLSLGHSSTEAEIEAFLKAWAKLAESLYKSGKQQDIAA